MLRLLPLVALVAACVRPPTSHTPLSRTGAELPPGAFARLDGDVLTIGFPVVSPDTGLLPPEPTSHRNTLYEWRFRTLGTPAAVASFALWSDTLREAAALEQIVACSTLRACLPRGGHFLECPRAATGTGVVHGGRVVLEVRDSAIVAAVRAGEPARLWLIARYATGAHVVDSVAVDVSSSPGQPTARASEPPYASPVAGSLPGPAARHLWRALVRLDSARLSTIADTALRLTTAARGDVELARSLGSDVRGDVARFYAFGEEAHWRAVTLANAATCPAARHVRALVDSTLALMPYNCDRACPRRWMAMFPLLAAAERAAERESARTCAPGTPASPT